MSIVLEHDGEVGREDGEAFFVKTKLCRCSVPDPDHCNFTSAV